MATEVVFTAKEEGDRLDLFLARETERSRRFIKEQIENGRIQVNGQAITKPSHRLKTGDRVSGELIDDYRPTLAPVEAPLDILHEDESILVLNKPQGMVVHPASGHRGETLVHYLLHHLKGNSHFVSTSAVRPGIVHRLDRGTSGVLLVAKTRKALEHLSAQFKSRAISKEYESVVWGKMENEGTFLSSIGRDTRDRKRMSSRSRTGREALTRWKVIETFEFFTHLDLFPHTGRTHQLRVHLSESGHAIVGDPLYGKSSLSRKKSLLTVEIKAAVESISHTLLHARSLTFSHPDSLERMTFTAPKPPLFNTFLSSVRK